MNGPNSYSNVVKQGSTIMASNTPRDSVVSKQQGFSNLNDHSFPPLYLKGNLRYRKNDLKYSSTSSSNICSKMSNCRIATESQKHNLVAPEECLQPDTATTTFYNHQTELEYQSTDVFSLNYHENPNINRPYTQTDVTESITNSPKGDHFLPTGITSKGEHLLVTRSANVGVVSGDANEKRNQNEQSSLPDFNSPNNINIYTGDDFGLESFLKYLNNKQSLLPGNEHMYGLDLGELLPKKAGSQLDTFQSPWTSVSALPQDIDYCNHFEYTNNYKIKGQLPPLQLRRYTDETLFFLFDMCIRDSKQLMAALELYDRGWRYHKLEKIWITKIAGVTPEVCQPDCEGGIYIYFNKETRQKEFGKFLIFYSHIENRPLASNFNF
ncbi:hypothetical protein Ahia01_000038500 [Argonauta hians]